jgi:hypothetical protein
MKAVLIALFGFMLVPSLAMAAGFAKESLFLSKTPVTEGETVLIHAVVANDGSTKFDGEVVFSDSDVKIGAVAVTIAPGGAQAVSVSWKPIAGSHTVTAKLTNKDGTVAEQESATFAIAEKPKPVTQKTVATSSAVTSSDSLQQKISDLSPAVAHITAPVFTILDSGRTKVAQLLDQGIEWAKKKVTPVHVLGAQTEKSSGSMLETIWFFVATILLYIFSLLRYIIVNPGIFYPVFALLFFYGLWRIYKRMRRPNY